MTYLYAIFYNGGHNLTRDPDEAQRLFDQYDTAEETPRVVALTSTTDVTEEFR